MCSLIKNHNLVLSLYPAVISSFITYHLPLNLQGSQCEHTASFTQQLYAQCKLLFGIGITASGDETTL